MYRRNARKASDKRDFHLQGVCGLFGVGRDTVVALELSKELGCVSVFEA